MDKSEQEYYGLYALKDYMDTDEFHEYVYGEFIARNGKEYEKVSESDFDDCFDEFFEEMQDTVLQAFNRAALHSCFSVY